MEVRQEVLEFGLVPTVMLPSKFDSAVAVTDLHGKLLQESETVNGQSGTALMHSSNPFSLFPGFVSVLSVRRLLRMSPDVWNVLYAVLHSISCRSRRKGWQLTTLDGTRIDIHALSLFLLAQVYSKQAIKRIDNEFQSGMHERGYAPRGLSSLTFASFLRRHLQMLLYLIKDNPPDLSSPAWCLPRTSLSAPPPPVPKQDTTRAIWISAEEVDRLEILLRPRPTENGDGTKMMMGASSGLSCFKSHRGTQMAGASCIEVATCLQSSILASCIRSSILDTEPEYDTLASAGRICGMTKGTLVKGEDSFPEDQLLIHECQDSCIYALAPLARAKVSACSDCIIILGPTTGCVIVENCTRIKLIYAAASTCITACHESVLHLATTRTPYLLGENRFLQLAPYNIEYERLIAHLEIAGLNVRPNLWDRPVLLNLFKEHKDGEGEGPSPTASSSRMDISTEDLLLPPDQLLPLTIPFKGGPGPLAGGSPSTPQISWVNRLGSGTGNGPPFPLSPAYANALTARLRRVAELQESVGKAIRDMNYRRDIQVAIQRYFKEWLFKTAKIRQVYDLAKLEQQMISETKNARSDNDNP